MRYEIVRSYDAPQFSGHGYVGSIARDSLSVGDVITPLDSEYIDPIQFELMSGVVKGVLTEYKKSDKLSEALVGLVGMIYIADIASRHKTSQSKILDDYFHLSPPARKPILASYPVASTLLDDVYNLSDGRVVGVIWKAGCDLTIYDGESGEILYRSSPGLGTVSGLSGRNDYLYSIGLCSGRELSLSDVITAANSIQDYDYYHR